MNLFQGIIDIFDGNKTIDLNDAWKRGVRVILHEASRGTYKKDALYKARKQQALGMGFLWAGYHLLSAEDIGAQLKAFLAMEDGADPRVGLAIDWEESDRGTASADQIRDFVRRFNEAMKPRYPDRYPIFYARHSILQEDQRIENGDALLGKCPLWYARYTNGPLEIPTKTWPGYTLWQFDDEKRKFGAPSVDVLPGADWNRFQGTESDLRNRWPFSAPANRGALPVQPVDGTGTPPVAQPVGSFADHVAAIALQEWSFFGSQTYDISGFPKQVGHKEGEDGWYQRIGAYWKDGAGLDGIDGRNHSWYWSAPFISWIMRSAGAGAQFHYSSEDSVYISQAIIDKRNGNLAAGFWGVRLTEAQAVVGDMVCWARQPGIAYDNLNGGNYEARCDLVVSVGPNQIDVIGGDVGDSVTRRSLALENGLVKEGAQSGEYLFALMKNRIV
ncbi:MAG: DUF2272 domain-containing protein [Chthoniobacterales bacterium]